jgi:hypothetical protein
MKANQLSRVPVPRDPTVWEERIKRKIKLADIIKPVHKAVIEKDPDYAPLLDQCDGISRQSMMARTQAAIKLKAGGMEMKSPVGDASIDEIDHALLVFMRRCELAYNQRAVVEPESE